MFLFDKEIGMRSNFFSTDQAENLMKARKIIICFFLLFQCVIGLVLARSLEDIREQTYILSNQTYYLAGENLYYVTFLFNAETGRSDTPSKILIAELTDTGGTLIYQHFHRMLHISSPGTFVLPDTLETGCYWIRAYTRYQVNFTENLIYYLPVFIINKKDLTNPGVQRDELSFQEDNIHNFQNGTSNAIKSNPLSRTRIELNIYGNSGNITIRDSINLQIHIADNTGKPVKSEFTIWIHDQEQFNADFIRLENLPVIMANKNSISVYNINEHRVSYKVAASSENNEIHYPQPEFPPQQELKLKGKYIDPNTNAGLSYRAISLTQTGENPGFKLLFTDREGNFEFNQLNFTNRENQLVLNAGNNKGIIIEYDSVKPSFHPPLLIGDLYEDPSFQQYLQKRSVEMQFKKFYMKPGDISADSISEHQTDRLRIYDHADIHYNMDDYIELKDMHEVIIELLPNVKIFKENGNTRIRIYHHSNADLFPDPLFLVNGRIVKDNDYILSMDNRNISIIEVLYDKTTLKPFGPLGIGGVVAIYTKKPVKIPTGLTVPMEGYHKPAREIIQQDESVKISENFPDFNPVLYWNPDGKTNEEGTGSFKFVANDLVSDFEVIVEGLTLDGDPFYVEKTISVKKPLHP